MNTEELTKNFIPMSETMLYMLFSLKQESYGYGIMQKVKGLTNGRIVLGAGTVYQTLRKLEKAKLITHTREEERKNFYVLTDSGQKVLALEAERIREIYKNLEGV